MGDQKKGWYRTKFILALFGFIILEEATPFVPLFGLIILVGCFVPKFYLPICRRLLRYYDVSRGTALAGRIPTDASVCAAQAKCPGTMST